RRLVLEPRRHARLPEVGRLVHVRVGVDDGVVDARDVVEQLRHDVLLCCLNDGTQSPTGRKNGAVTLPSIPAKRSGRNTTSTGMSAASASGAQSTMRVATRTPGSSSSATSAETKGSASPNCGRNACFRTTQVKSVPRPLIRSQV